MVTIGSWWQYYHSESCRGQAWRNKMKIPDYLTKEVNKTVRRDIDPTPFAVNFRIGAALILGGVLSLFFCGQFGFGFTELANSVHQFVHHAHGSFWCMVVCGFLFVLIPVLLLRLFCRPMMFRKIVTSRKVILFFWLGLAEFMLAFRGNYLPSWQDAVVWFIVAMFTLWGVSRLVDRMSKYFYKADSGGEVIHS
jgi:hypothetical protein